MGKFKQFFERTNFSITPVITPLAAGKGMTVKPTVLLGSVILYLTGEEHAPDCECEVCVYRRDDSLRQQVLQQRETTRQTWQQIKTDVSDEYANLHRNYHGRIGLPVANYWADWMISNFGEPFILLRDDVVRDLLDVHEDGAAEVLLHYLYDAKPEVWTSPILTADDWFDFADDPYEKLHFLASMQLVGSEA